MDKLLDYLHHIPWEELRKDYGLYGEAIVKTYQALLGAVEHFQADQIEASFADYVVFKNGEVVHKLSHYRGIFVRQGILTQEEDDIRHRNVASGYFQALRLIVDKDPVIQHHLKVKFRNNKKIIVTIQALEDSAHKHSKPSQ